MPDPLTDVINGFRALVARDRRIDRIRRVTMIDWITRAEAARQREQTSPTPAPKGPPMPAPTSNQKRSGLMRALGAVKAQAAVDVAMSLLADLAERNNARAHHLANDGISRENAKALMMDQMEREQVLEELERAIGGNFPPGPLGDTPPPEPHGETQGEG